MRGYSGMGPYRKNTGNIAGVEIYQCANIETSISPVYTNRTVSANFRGPEFPQGFFGIQSMMDDVAAKLKMDPVEFILKNMTRKAGDQTPYTELLARRVHPPRRRGIRVEEALAPQPGSDPRPDQARRRRVVHGVPRRPRPQQRRRSASTRKGSTRCTSASPTSAAARRPTMGLIAAEELGVPLSQLDVVWGDTDRCPLFGRRIGEPHDDHDRLRRRRGCARPEEADRRQGPADGRRGVDRVGDVPTRRCREGAQHVRRAFRRGRGRHRARARPRHQVPRRARLRADHEPADRAQPDQGGAIDGDRDGAARGPDLRPAQRHRRCRPATTARGSRRIATRRTSRSSSSSRDDGLGPFGAKSMGESSKVPSPAAVANAVFNAIGVRMKDLPITREKIVGALARTERCGHEGLHQRQPARRVARRDACITQARSDEPDAWRSPAAAATCSG